MTLIRCRCFRLAEPAGRLSNSARTRCTRLVKPILTAARAIRSARHIAQNTFILTEGNRTLISSQVFIGVSVALLCGIAFRHGQWFVHQTPKGKRLLATFGEERAILIWRAFLLTGVVFGACLATGHINPVMWEQ